MSSYKFYSKPQLTVKERKIKEFKANIEEQLKVRTDGIIEVGGTYIASSLNDYYNKPNLSDIGTYLVNLLNGNNSAKTLKLTLRDHKITKTHAESFSKKIMCTSVEELIIDSWDDEKALVSKELISRAFFEELENKRQNSPVTGSHRSKLIQNTINAESSMGRK